MIPRATGTRRRIVIVALEEYRRALETRWLFAFTALFAVLVLGL